VRDDRRGARLLEPEIVRVLKLLSNLVELVLVLELAPRVLSGLALVARLVARLGLCAAHNLLVGRHVLLVLLNPAAVKDVATVRREYWCF